MNFLSHFRTALLAISRNRLRSFLATLAILIGVSAVITMMAIGQASQAKLQEIIGQMGTSSIFIIPGTVTKGGITQYSVISTLTPGDVDAIRKDCPDVRYITPQDQDVELVVFGTQNWTTLVQGAGADFFNIGAQKVGEGRGFTKQEVRLGDKVCLLGPTVVSKLFGDENPIGKTIRIKHTPFRVIGVMAPQGQFFGQDQDDDIIAPYTTVMHRITGDNRLRWITAAAMSNNQVSEARDEIEALLHERHHIASWQQDDFFIRTPDEFLEILTQSASVVEILLGAAAGISLLVGGIGIMNTMISNVVERTREIGIRMAVGATRENILSQFLVEAVVLSVAGGMLGLLIGLLFSVVVAKLMQVPFALSPGAILMAVGFSAMVGIFFGYYPARRASLLDPIEALRYQ